MVVRHVRLVVHVLDRRDEDHLLARIRLRQLGELQGRDVTDARRADAGGGYASPGWNDFQRCAIPPRFARRKAMDRAALSPAALWSMTRESVSAWMRRLRTEHGCGHRVLHGVFDRAAAHHRHRRRGLLLRQRRRERVSVRAARGPARRAGRRGRPGHGREREQHRTRASSRASSASCCSSIGATTVFAELQSDLDRIWKAPAVKKTGGPVGTAPRPRAVVRARGQHRIPDAGVAGGQRRAVGAGRVVERPVRRTVEWLLHVLDFVREPRRDHGDVRAHVQDPAAREDRLARRVDRRDRHRAAVHDRQRCWSACTSARAASHRASAPRARSPCCWSGSTTRRRSFCSARSSPGSTRTATARGKGKEKPATEKASMATTEEPHGSPAPERAAPEQPVAPTFAQPRRPRQGAVTAFALRHLAAMTGVAVILGAAVSEFAKRRR